MKYLAKDSSLCIQCGICEETCSMEYFDVSDASKSCIQIGKGLEPDINTCNQCGVCMDICPTQAIYRDKLGIVKINREICVGCFMCVGFCPEEAMRQHDEYIEPFKCIACGLCAEECPSGAIFVDTKEDAKDVAFAD